MAGQQAERQSNEEALSQRIGYATQAFEIKGMLFPLRALLEIAASCLHLSASLPVLFAPDAMSVRPCCTRQEQLLAHPRSGSSTPLKQLCPLFPMVTAHRGI